MKVRIISAIIILIVFIPLLWVGGVPFAIAMGILSILAYNEIINLKKSHNEIPNLVKAIGLVCLLYIVLGDYKTSSMEYVLSYSKLILPIVGVLIPTIFYKKNKYTTNDALYLLGCIYLLGIFFNLVITTREISLGLIAYLLSVTIFTDTFAYLIGCLIGKHKMCEISPNKTWEGAIAGVIGGVAIALIVYCYFVGSFSIKLLLLTITLSIIGQIGDLIFSKIKRENKIKDFSNLIPGHGGVLDRIDSIAFVVLSYVMLEWFL